VRVPPIRPGATTRRALIAATIATLTLPASGSAIIGGGPVPAGSMRGLVRIDLPDDVCSGSLVTSRIVITALHCVQAPQDGVTPTELGRHAQVTVGNPNGGRRVQVRGVSAVDVAPQTDPPPPTTHQVDVVVLVLDREVDEPLTRLAPPPEVPDLTAAGKALLLAGFGASVSPPPDPSGREAVLEVSRVLKQTALVTAACQDGVSPYVVCAGPVGGEGVGGVPTGNSCAGDSGAPVLSHSPSFGGAIAQVGVLSGATGVDQCSQSNVTVITPLNTALATWLQTILAAPLPPQSRPPRRCTGLERSLKRARNRGVKGRRSARRLSTEIYRNC
jgi:hypothetical protein